MEGRQDTIERCHHVLTRWHNISTYLREGEALSVNTYHSQVTSETTSMRERGSVAPRPPGQDGPDMETSAHHRSTRNTAALALPGLPPLWRRKARERVPGVTVFLSCLEAPSCQLPPNEKMNGVCSA